jgi:hypothetical protein
MVGEKFEVVAALLALIANTQDGPAAIRRNSFYDRSLAGRSLDNVYRMS